MTKTKTKTKKPTKPTTPRAKNSSSQQSAGLRRKLFVEAYIANGGNATDAARQAGYSEKTARQQGARQMSHAAVSAAIAERAEKLADKYALTTEMVARSIVQEMSFDPSRLYREDGSLKDITELDEDTRMALTAVEFEQLGGPDAPVIVRKVKWATKHQAREQAMKHLGMFERDNAQRAGLLGDLPREAIEAIRDRLHALAKRR